MERTYKNALSVRGDSLYCPLSFSLDSYWNCLVDCHHCSFRSLNHVWGTDLRPADPELVRKKLIAGLKNDHPITPLAYCIRDKKTLRFGSRTDPFQPIEDQYRVSARMLEVLNELDWTFVIQTRFPSRLVEHEKLLKKGKAHLIIVMSPGLENDWKILEKGITDHPNTRIQIAKFFMKRGVTVGFNGEPFIPSYHTIDDFERTLKLLKENGIKSYNTYNFHFNAYVARRLYAIGVDIEAIQIYNQDNKWKPILQELLKLSQKYNIKLGCPDFVNSGKDWIEPANTCCGIDVPVPTTYNAHTFKRLLQKGMSIEEVLSETYDGTGDKELGEKVLRGTTDKYYTVLHPNSLGLGLEL